MMGNELLDRLRAAFAESSYQRRLGAEIESAADGQARVVLAMRPANANRGGNLHGGAHASLMLSAACLATASTERRPTADKAMSPRSLAISYLGAARSVGVRAHGSVVRRGRDVAHVRVSIDSDDGDSIASGYVTVAIHEQGALSSSATSAGTRRKAALFGRVSTDQGAPVEGSPFLRESGLVVLAEEPDDWQSLLIPVAHNEDGDGHVDDGAVVGLVDNCGSMAAYTAEGIDREMLGVTLSMSMVFARSMPGSVVGSLPGLRRNASTIRRWNGSGPA